MNLPQLGLKYHIGQKKKKSLISAEILLVIWLNCCLIILVQGRNTVFGNHENKLRENFGYTGWSTIRREQYFPIERRGENIYDEDDDDGESFKLQKTFTPWKIEKKELKNGVKISNPTYIKFTSNFNNKKNQNKIQSKTIEDEFIDTENDDLQSFEDISSTTISNNIEKNELEKLLDDLQGEKELFDSSEITNNYEIETNRGRRGRRRHLSSQEQGALLMETLKKKRNYTDFEDNRGHHETNLHSGIMDMLGRSMSTLESTFMYMYIHRIMAMLLLLLLMMMTTVIKKYAHEFPFRSLTVTNYDFFFFFFYVTLCDTKINDDIRIYIAC